MLFGMRCAVLADYRMYAMSVSFHEKTRGYLAVWEEMSCSGLTDCNSMCIICRHPQYSLTLYHAAWDVLPFPCFAEYAVAVFSQFVHKPTNARPVLLKSCASWASTLIQVPQLSNSTERVADTSRSSWGLACIDHVQASNVWWVCLNSMAMSTLSPHEWILLKTPYICFWLLACTYIRWFCVTQRRCLACSLTSWMSVG